jgi:starch phosphorylase
MTHLALQLSHRTNGVSQRHGEVSSQLFAQRTLGAITNGVHAATWAAPAMQELFDQFLPGWRSDSARLRKAVAIPNDKLWPAHRRAKRRLIEHINGEANAGMQMDAFTIGFARRAALYKRADMIFDDVERLTRIHADYPFQLVFAGKAHPHDQAAKELIQRIVQARDRIKNVLRVVYLENYDMRLCRMMVSGVDLWLNTPEPPLEASGTSGMKAAVNGVPSLSVLDGWWLEGWIEGITGWAIGKDDYPSGVPHDRGKAARQMYDKLEYVILPLFYGRRDQYIEVMKHCIALNGPHFSTHRMMQEYVSGAYFC